MARITVATRGDGNEGVALPVDGHEGLAGGIDNRHHGVLLRGASHNQVRGITRIGAQTKSSPARFASMQPERVRRRRRRFPDDGARRADCCTARHTHITCIVKCGEKLSRFSPAQVSLIFA